jgi:hypothetical protein
MPKTKPAIKIVWPPVGNGYVQFNDAALHLLGVKRKKAPGKVPVTKSKPTFVMFFNSSEGTGFVTVNEKELDKMPATPIIYEERLNAYGTQPYAPNVPALISLLGQEVKSGTWEAEIEERVINKKTLYFIVNTHEVVD